MNANLYLAGGTAQPTKRAIHVLFAVDRSPLRQILRLVLDGAEGVEIVAECSDVDALVCELTAIAPDVLVLDLQLARGRAADLIRRIHARTPETEIVVLTMQTSAAFARETLDAGALGYVVKEHADRDLARALTAAAGGEEFVSPAVDAGVAALRTSLGEHGLTARETEILRLTALGHTSPEISEQLHLSRRTIESHRARIYRKLGLATRAELVHYALESKLIGR